jgi:hypothetical protein
VNRYKIFSLFFAALIFGTRVGFAVNIHYCGNSIAEISIAYNPQKCDMGDGAYSQTSDKTSFSKKSCCADEVFLFQNHEPQKNQTEFHSQELSFIKDTLLPSQLLEQLNIVKVEKFSIWYPPPESRKLFLINQSLVFYD